MLRLADIDLPMREIRDKKEGKKDRK